MWRPHDVLQALLKNLYKIHVMKSSVASIDVLGEINIGDKLSLLGATTDIEMIVKSTKIENEEVKVFNKGQKVGIKVPERVRTSDEVFKISE